MADDRSLEDRVNTLENVVCIAIGMVGAALVVLGQILPMWHTSEPGEDDPPAQAIRTGFWALGLIRDNPGGWILTIVLFGQLAMQIVCLWILVDVAKRQSNASVVRWSRRCAWLAMGGSWLIFFVVFIGAGLASDDYQLGISPLMMMAGSMLAVAVTNPRFLPLWLENGDRRDAAG